MDVLNFLLELNAFGCALALSPLIFFSYLVVRISHNIWFNVISFLHPELQFVRDTTLRTLSDTHRNQGIIAVLLTVKGGANYEAVKRHLLEVVQRTDKLGNVVFPRLKESLVARFGTYAWQNVGNFDLEQNLLVAPITFKGRAISDINIQDCVSDIVSKYLPTGVPPWQLVIIPSTIHQHYMLLRLHHVLLSDGFNIGDLLPLESTIGYSIEPNTPSILRNVFKEPKSIPGLRERITEDFTNRWNEFISNYDPLEKTELLKCTPGFFEYLAILLITSVSIWKEYAKGLHVIKNNSISKLKLIINVAESESLKRKVNVSNLVASIFVSLDPRNVIVVILRNIWRWVLSTTVKLPVRIYNEAMALHTCINLQYCAYPNTTVALIYNYVPLIFRATKELLYCIKVVFKTPKAVIQEAFGTQDILETITFCGRKVVAWSEPVKTEYIQEIAKRTGVSETEIILATCSSAIAHYFQQIHDVPPKEIAITARNISSSYIFATNSHPADSIGGMICLDLPILDIKKDIPLLENLHKIKRNTARAMDTQPLTYLLSSLQTRYGTISKLLPATIIAIFLRVLSLKYSVCFTEVTTKHPNIRQKTIWGQEVMSAIYWRPPQANISISLCVNQYADHVVMGVMSDAQLAPHHPALARSFSDHLEDLAIAAGVQ